MGMVGLYGYDGGLKLGEKGKMKAAVKSNRVKGSRRGKHCWI